MDTESIKSHIYDYYSQGEAWRENFADTSDMTLMSRLINYLKRRQFSLILQLMEKYPGDIIDAGCGNGLYSVSLAQSYPARQVRAVDFSPSMCAVVNRKKQALNLLNLIVYHHDIDNLPFDHGEVEVVMCLDTLHHVPDDHIDKPLQEFARVLRPAGKLIVDFKNKRNPYVAYSHRRRNRLSYFRTNRTLAEMRSFLRDAGFEIENVYGVGFPWAALAPYVVIIARKE